MSPPPPIHPPGLDYIAGLFGYLYAGALPVPAYPPDPGALRRTVPRVRAIAADAGATVALTTAAVRTLVPTFAAQAPDLVSLEWVATDEVADAAADGWRPPAVHPASVAFLQYTSGSTGTPKGVMVSHANLLHNIRALERCCPPPGPGAHAVSWVPPYHDMGLVYGILVPLHLGMPSVLMSPLAFLERPRRWLAALSRWRGTISGGTGFAYDLCVRRIRPDERAGLDLSSWRLAGIGGEPLRASVFESFAAAFRDAGFDPTAFGAAYGLAEATLMVTGPQAPVRSPMTVRRLDRARLAAGRAVDTETEGAWPAVDCGQPLPDQRTLVVDPTTREPLPVRAVGEIWVSGPSVARGYWNRPAETERTFGARLASGDGPFLRTGDLGFVDEDGRFFVVGRCKDLIIIRGTNHYPDDIEATVAQCHSAVRPGCGAAFSVDDGDEERLVVVQEVRPGDHDLAAVARAIRLAVAETHGVQVDAIVLIKPGRLVKTSSGKIARGACRAAFPLDAPDGLAARPDVRHVDLAPRRRLPRHPGADVSAAR